MSLLTSTSPRHPPPELTPIATAGSHHDSVRCGVDVASVRDVASSLARFGDRYLRRLFTEREVRESDATDADVRARSLAARFAAKEATFKLLAVGSEQPAWTDVEVCRVASGGCMLALHRGAKTMAERAGIADIALSMSHEHDVAIAFVVALCGAAPLDPEGSPCPEGSPYPEGSPCPESSPCPEDSRWS